MHVLLTCHRFPPDDLGGVQLYTLTLAAELVKNGHTVAIVTRRLDSATLVPRLAREQLPDGTVLYRITGGTFTFDPFQDHPDRLEQLLLKVLDEAAPDLLHVNHLLGLTPRVIELAHRQEIPVVVTLHDFHFACSRVHLQKPSGELCSGPDGGRECSRTCFVQEGSLGRQRHALRNLWFQGQLRLADRLICPSRYVASFFMNLGADADRLRVIPNGTFIEGVKPEKETPLPVVGGCIRLACIGILTPHKGAHRVLEALKIAQLGPVDFLLLGDAPISSYAQDLRAQAADIPGLKVRLYGRYNPRELPLLLAGVDCVIVPSQVPESFSLTTREALILGIPVLVSRLGALPEAVVENHNGLTFDPFHLDELVAKLKILAEDRPFLERLRKGARQTPICLMAQHVTAVLAVYDDAIRHLANKTFDRSGDLQELAALYSLLRRVRAA